MQLRKLRPRLTLSNGSVSAVSVQTEAVILVLGLQHVACGVKRTVVITEGGAQDDGLTGKLAVISQ